ncbi:central kinetochore subunit Mal2/MCM21 [Coccidioides immitis RS]|uniref:Central kinetochore subunit Mal2/MCM21 n=4 Tax=Coccidioides immitis TaxID=5501 RepID=J3KGS4_COCIM|nr:central kinetochore subunit Mal2/MCM21 [Coccidioides immitis RS]KMP00183.1 hypothetical protein CIRG_00325 [Coccidioides immitis RMSCC 2394]KMU81729.1 hypothetical protein CISG_02747 [Coccidioides immitis RMSCC 3703]KMU84369.1 hypothetical protein CIHG_02154 [Coccidioides immitis H538.4]TPX26723.1 hypothetical protein DIZ76_012185 [Coccidioides immitis]EAS34979.3 central kinetochore subunit Mal2/MCM21 [Coccidioides immitis RS]
MEQTTPPEPNPSLVLDEEISKIRSEIQNLTKRRRVLSASLLSTNAVQSALGRQNASDSNPSLVPVVLDSQNHALSNHHRAVFSTTSFPFKDPSPHSRSQNLLGIRIDICTRGGRYSKPYYLLLERAHSDQTLLRVHRHTIPTFIPLNQLERKYLAVPDVDSELQQALKAKPGKQDLKRFVRQLRRELVAWHLRRDAIAWLREELGIDKVECVGDSQGSDSLAVKLGISSITPASLEARYLRFEWRDGRVGQIQLSSQGLVERAVVVSSEGRDMTTENLFLRGDRRIETAVQRLLDANMTG